ncbi:MAG: SDR family oxidoreductase [Ignavibacteria bacterium]|jgi:uncharacterized protein YbjT (DUF2867 family)
MTTKIDSKLDQILIAGATGYLGRYITKELVKQDYKTNVLIRNLKKFKQFKIEVDEVIEAKVTNKSTLTNCCKNIDVVISTIGITKQKDGLSYMDVDYHANLNLLNEAKKSKVKKFIYVSVLNGESLRNLKICEAKEKFVDKLKSSGIGYCVIRPNGFFSDITEFLNMAKKGKVFLFGNGKQKTNPIHGEDLAKVCVEAISSNEKEIEVGGPDTLTHNDIAELAFNTIGVKPKIVHIADWIRKLTLKTAKIFMNKISFGPVEFFLNVMAIDMIAPRYGKHHLKDFFKENSNGR